MPSKISLETNRLTIRDNEEKDLQNMHTLLSNKQAMYFLNDISTETIEQTAQNLNSAIKNADGHYFCIEKKDTNEYIGQVGYTIVEENPLGKVVHMGYFILPQHFNKGYTTEAVKKVLEFAFLHDGCVRVNIACYSDNVPSRKVMEKVGFRKEAEKIGAQYHDGKMKNRVEYALNKEEWEISNEIEAYNSLHCNFERFLDVPVLRDGDIFLACINKKPADAKKIWTPAYSFVICKDGEGEVVGDIRLRVGYSTGLYYGGQIGYNVDEKFRGNGYAVKACQLLIPLIKFHEMEKVLITNSADNIPSMRVCEKLGAKHVRVAKVPEWHDMYERGLHNVNIYEWSIS